MNEQQQPQCTAFEGFQRIASGELADVVAQVKAVIDRGERAPIMIFDDSTSRPIEVDFRGTLLDVRKRLAQGIGCTPDAAAPDPDTALPRGPGRPKLGVVGREVTLLPRHWDWLSSQPGGASVALRKLVDQARRANEQSDRVRQAQEAAYRFMSAIAGNRVGFEEATRALFAGKRTRFEEMIEGWPVDVREHAQKLAAGAFAGS